MTRKSPIPADLEAAIAELSEPRQTAIVAWLRELVGRMNRPTRPARIRRPAILGIGETPSDSHEANPAWLGRIDIDDFGGNAA